MGSYPYGVSPSLEQRWREEVLYLHSLWHKGPPRNPNPRPNSNNLGPSNPTTFKKRKNKHEDAKKKKDPKPIVSEVEWPCGPDPEPRQETGWPQSNSQSDQATRPATAEEQAKSTALHLQQKGLKACQDFFSSKVCSDEEEEEEFMDDDVDESEEFKFFMGIFTDNRDLRSYYEKNWESGEFCCLVCGGTGKKVWKRFKNCVALVQHSTAISKTKRRAAHRAFGKTICRVLGWEIHRLPSIVLSMDGPLGRSLAKAECEENSAQKKDLQENYVDLDDDDDDDEEMDPDYIPGVDVQDDDDEEETDPDYHIPGIDVQKEDFQGQVVNSVTVEKDYGVSIQEEDFQGKAFKTETGRPQSNFQSDQAARPVTVEEQAKSTAHHLQQKGLKACQDFFSSKVCADDEEEEELMDDDVDESEEFKFFVRIFTDNRDLRSYYEKNWESGEFCCLVCGGTGKKVWKRFKNCVALVQHSTAISKTKRRAAHRAFGKTICQVLGWEIHQLPRIFLSMDGPLGRSLAKAECEVGLKEDSAKKEDLRENYVDLVDDDDDDEEPDPDDHGVGIQKEDFQGKVVDSVTIDEDERMDIQVGTKNNEELHQKDLTSEIVEMEGACNEDEIDHRTR